MLGTLLWLLIECDECCKDLFILKAKASSACLIAACLAFSLLKKDPEAALIFFGLSVDGTKPPVVLERPLPPSAVYNLT